jgi:hypothetical protein
MNAQNEKQALAELAPFYVAGTLGADEKSSFETALAHDPELALNVALARAEREQVVALNEALPAPGPRATEKLFALLDAQPKPAPTLRRRLDLGARLAEVFTPRALGWVAAAACLLVAVETGFLLQPEPKGSFVTASQTTTLQDGRFALVAFAPDASASKITEFLAKNGAEIVAGPRGGFFRVRLGDADMSEAEAAKKLEALRASGLARFAEHAPR